MVVILLACGGALAIFVPYVYRQRLLQRRTLCENRQIATARAILANEALAGHFLGYRNAAPGAQDAEPLAESWAPPVLTHLGRSGESLVPEFVCSDNPPPREAPPRDWLAWVVNAGLPDVPNDSGLPPDWPANGVFLDRHHPTAGQVREGQKIETSLAFLNEHDGSENTLLLSENLDAGRWTDTEEPQLAFVWTPGMFEGTPTPRGVVLEINRRSAGGNGPYLRARPASYHRGGVNAAFCSGATRFLAEKIDYLVYCRLMTPHDEGLTLAGSKEPAPQPFRP